MTGCAVMWYIYSLRTTVVVRILLLWIRHVVCESTCGLDRFAPFSWFSSMTDYPRWVQCLTFQWPFCGLFKSGWIRRAKSSNKYATHNIPVNTKFLSSVQLWPDTSSQDDILNSHVDVTSTSPTFVYSSTGPNSWSKCLPLLSGQNVFHFYHFLFDQMSHAIIPQTNVCRSSMIYASVR